MLKEDIHNTGAREEPSEILQLLTVGTDTHCNEALQEIGYHANQCLPQ